MRKMKTQQIHNHSRSLKSKVVVFGLVFVVTLFCLVIVSYSYDFYYYSRITTSLSDIAVKSRDVMRGYRWHKEISSDKLLKLNVVPQEMCADLSCNKLVYPFQGVKIISGPDGINLYMDVFISSSFVCNSLLKYDFQTETGLLVSLDISKQVISRPDDKIVGNYTFPVSPKVADDICDLGIGDFILITYNFSFKQ